MPRGYWIVSADVTNGDQYRHYVEANAEAFAQFGARFLVRGASPNFVEGQGRTRNVVVEFKDYATALACYHSDAYQRAARLRQGAAEATIIILEGYDGAQPEQKS